jgi:UDP-3-O-[3-hydroxymyristoyl] glucosamine N-acyltransferase
VPAGIALARPESVSELARRLGGNLVDADAARIVRRLRAPALRHEVDELVVMTRASAAPAGALLEHAVLLCSPELAPRFEGRPRWVHAHAMWVVARLLHESAPPAPPRALAEPAVSPAARIGAGVQIAHGAVIYPGVVLGDGVRVAEHAVLHDNVHVGARTSIGVSAVLGRAGFGFVQGPAGERLRMPHPAGVRIGDDVELGPLCTIDAGTLNATRIGDRTKLDAHVHVAHNVVIGNDCYVAAQAGFAGSVVLGDGVLVGGQAGIADHCTIGDGARIMAQAGVIGDVPPGAEYAGYPAQPRTAWLRAWATLRRGEKQTRGK